MKMATGRFCSIRLKRIGRRTSLAHLLQLTKSETRNVDDICIVSGVVKIPKYLIWRNHSGSRFRGYNLAISSSKL